ncbi:MAG: formylglycine-generating enzyme family protein [Dehalococcoidia bacterium]
MTSDGCACCSPSAQGRVQASPRETGKRGKPSSTLIALAGGTFTMGSDADEGEPSDGEAPTREVTLSPFRIDSFATTNRQFRDFVEDTGYVTEAEAAGWSFVFAGLLPAHFPETRGVQAAPWWRAVEGASWRRPEGPGSDAGERPEHPVVHVSWNDAQVYCLWAGGRLPTEAEWEFAARGGLHQTRFPWGDELVPAEGPRMNVWQGAFPRSNSMDDGYYGTAPVNAFAPNAFGLFNMCGNTWEWCADWFTARHSGAALADPEGPETGAERVIRGGSYLCHESYCNRYRVSARSSNTPSSTTGHMGFRCAMDA